MSKKESSVPYLKDHGEGAHGLTRPRKMWGPTGKPVALHRLSMGETAAPLAGNAESRPAGGT